MSMRLAHPALTTTGKKRGKQKFRNSEQAQRARALEQEWQELQKKWQVEADQRKERRAMTASTLSYSLKPPIGREGTQHIPSLVTDGGDTTLKTIPEYTGDKVLGVTVMHKSCLQPIFNEQAAIDAAKMRRG